MISLDLTDRLVVVVGGGPVGQRKAASALAAGASVRVIALENRPSDVSPAIEWFCESYRADHLDGAALVFAAATADVNALVVSDSTVRHVWVCDSTIPTRGDFTTPATAELGAVTITVDTGGAAPALARRLRDKIRDELDPAIADWAELLAEVRDVVRKVVPDQAVRRRLLDDFADWQWLDRLRTSGRDATREAMLWAVAEGS